MEGSKPVNQASLELPDEAVKEPKTLHKSPEPGPRFVRLLEGWELGAIVVGMVLVTALLAVPRAARPGVFPLPLVDVAEAEAERALREGLVAAAERDGLPFETRAVGDAVRRLGVALSGGAEDAEHLRALIDERVHSALGAGQLEGLVRLRAVQAQLFVRAVRAQRFGEPASDELRALGGDFATRALTNGWAGPHGCIASDDELTALFERRWLELTRLRDEPRFRPKLGELRRYFRFLLLFPEAAPGHAASRAERAAARLRYVEALGRRDTEYPLSLARGSLLAEMGMMPQSAEALGRHLARPGSTTWNLRARNYLLYAARGQADFGGEAGPPDAP